MDTDVRLLVAALRRDVPHRPAWPGGYPDEIDAALVDAVYSIRAKYSATKGPRGVVDRWRRHRGDRDDLAVLAATPVADLVPVFGNRQRTGGLLKAEAISRAAGRLRDAGVRHAADLDPANPEHRRAYTGVAGLGPVTWAYFAMLLGHAGIKADTWVVRYVRETLGREVSAEDAGRLLLSAAAELGRPATEVDHAVWLFMRSR